MLVRQKKEESQKGADRICFPGVERDLFSGLPWIRPWRLRCAEYPRYSMPLQTLGVHRDLGRGDLGHVEDFGGKRVAAANAKSEPR